jgi:hypothetical protein
MPWDYRVARCRRKVTPWAARDFGAAMAGTSWRPF